MEGKIIVIEGACDGIGKTTQFEMLYEHLKKDKVEIFKHHFPSYNTYQGEPVESYLRGEYGKIEELSPYFINNLYAMDRAITYQIKLKKELDKGKTILLDRYTTSSLIYQSALIDDIEKKKEFIDYIIDFEYNKLGIKKPDKVIFLYAAFDLVTKLRNERKENEGIEKDIHESNIEFMKKIYDNAMFVADYLNWNKVKCDKDNKIKEKEEIHKKIYELVRK